MTSSPMGKGVEDDVVETVPTPGIAPKSKEHETMGDVIRNARLATEKEHRMTLWQGLRLYPKAIAWSVLISTCIVMEGYDISLVNNFYAFPQFNQKYGVPITAADGSVTYQVPASWQAGLSNGAVVVSLKSRCACFAQRCLKA